MKVSARPEEAFRLPKRPHGGTHSPSMAAPGDRSPRAAVRGQATTGGPNPSGICEVSASVGQYLRSHIPEHVRVGLGATDTAAIGEGCVVVFLRVLDQSEVDKEIVWINARRNDDVESRFSLPSVRRVVDTG